MSKIEELAEELIRCGHPAIPEPIGEEGPTISHAVEALFCLYCGAMLAGHTNPPPVAEQSHEPSCVWWKLKAALRWQMGIIPVPLLKEPLHQS